MPIELGGVGTNPTRNSLERLSTGKRVNRGGDDAAGLAVAEGLDSTMRSEVQAGRNISDGLGASMISSGATSQVGDIAARMRELAVQGSSDLLSDSGRAALDKEFQQLTAEVDRIAESTQMNGVALTDGSRSTLEVQAGPGDSAADRIDLPMADLRAETLGLDAGSIDLSTAEGARAALSTIDGAQEQLNTSQSEQGAAQNQLSSALESLSTSTEAHAAAASRIVDTDYAAESAELASAQLRQDIDVAMRSHAQISNGAALKLLG